MTTKTSALVKEVNELASDLKNKSVFDLASDLPLVGDVLIKAANAIQTLDARVSALEGKAK